jgi:hypothetical protein
MFGIAAMISHPPVHKKRTGHLVRSNGGGYGSSTKERGGCLDRNLDKGQGRGGEGLCQWFHGRSAVEKGETNECSRRLGLAGNPEQDLERTAIMAHYAELAQQVGVMGVGYHNAGLNESQIFQTPFAGVAILRDDVEYRYTTDVSLIITSPAWTVLICVSPRPSL